MDTHGYLPLLNDEELRRNFGYLARDIGDAFWRDLTNNMYPITPSHRNKLKRRHPVILTLLDKLDIYRGSQLFSEFDIFVDAIVIRNYKFFYEYIHWMVWSGGYIGVARSPFDLVRLKHLTSNKIDSSLKSYLEKRRMHQLNMDLQVLLNYYNTIMVAPPITSVSSSPVPSSSSVTSSSSIPKLISDPRPFNRGSSSDPRPKDLNLTSLLTFTLKCVQCQSAPRDSVFIPCGHLSHCYLCGKDMDVCPTCHLTSVKIYTIRLP